MSSGGSEEIVVPRTLTLIDPIWPLNWLNSHSRGNSISPERAQEIIVSDSICNLWTCQCALLEDFLSPSSIYSSLPNWAACRITIHPSMSGEGLPELFTCHHSPSAHRQQHHLRRARLEITFLLELALGYNPFFASDQLTLSLPAILPHWQLQGIRWRRGIHLINPIEWLPQPSKGACISSGCFEGPCTLYVRTL